MKSGFYTTNGSDQLSGWTGLRRSSKALPKVKHAPKKKKSWSLFGGLLLIWSTIAFWIRVKPLHVRSTPSKLRGCTESWSQHWPTEWAQFSAIPDHMSHNQCFKSWTNWAMKFCLMRHIHLTSRQPTATSSNISTTFCRKNASRTSRKQKMLSKSSLNPEAQIFMLQD